MKIKSISIIALLIVSMLMVQEVYTFSNYGFPDHAGAPVAASAWSPATTQATCSTSGCHAGKVLNDPSALAEFTTTIPSTGWQPGVTYDITAKITKANITAFGFMTMAWGKTDSLSTGSLSTMPSSKAQIVNSWFGNGNRFATHKSASISGNGSNEWTFQWTAPQTGNDTVVFYSTFVAANSNGQPSGDFVFTKQYKVGKSLIPTATTDEIEKNPLGIQSTLVDSYLKINLPITVGEQVEITILDMSSRVVLKKTIPAAQLEFIDVSQLVTGVYVVAVGNGLEQKSARFVKM